MKRRLCAILAVLLASFGIASGARAEVGGTPAYVPQVVELTIVGPSGTGLCTGTLVRPRLVLTAAHCIQPGSHVELRIGGRRFNCWNVVVDPSYDPNAYHNDLAFLVLFRRAPKRIKPVPVGVYRFDAPAISYGYGDPTDGHESKNTFVLPDGGGSSYLVAYGGSGQSLGSGDSGGPLVQNGQVVGVNESSYGLGQQQDFAYIDQWAWDHIAADH